MYVYYRERDREREVWLVLMFCYITFIVLIISSMIIIISINYINSIIIVVSSSSRLNAELGDREGTLRVAGELSSLSSSYV